MFFWSGSDWFIDIFMCSFAGFLAIETICGIFWILHWKHRNSKKSSIYFVVFKLQTCGGCGVNRFVIYTNMFKQFTFVGFKRFYPKNWWKNKSKNNLEWKNACDFSMYTFWAQHKFSNLSDFHVFPAFAWKKTKNAGLSCLNSLKPAKVVDDSLPQG